MLSLAVNHERDVKTRVSIANLQIKFDEMQFDFVTQTLQFQLKLSQKIKLLAKIELTDIFYERIYY